MTALSRLVLLFLETARDTDALLAGIAGWNDLLRKVLAAPDGVARSTRRAPQASCSRAPHAARAAGGDRPPPLAK